MLSMIIGKQGSLTSKHCLVSFAKQVFYRREFSELRAQRPSAINEISNEQVSPIIPDEKHLLTQNNSQDDQQQDKRPERAYRWYAPDELAKGPRPSWLPNAAPNVPLVSEQDIQRLAHFINSNPGLTVVTGAGVSTESNIPDYRGPAGAYKTGFQPITHQMFMKEPASRQRYWSRSFAGWYQFSSIQYNMAHQAIATLQNRGWFGTVITQNVDRLHHKAGSTRVIELHGTTYIVQCMSCGARVDRYEFQTSLASLNPEADRVARMTDMQRQQYWATHQSSTNQGGPPGTSKREGLDEQVPVLRPDGDVELVDAGTGFRVPQCTACSHSSSFYKPGVVFFGDNVPKTTTDSAREAAQSGAMLIIGTSMSTWSSYRLAQYTHNAGHPVAVLGVGPTRADDLTQLKVQGLAGQVLGRLMMHEDLQLPAL